MGPAGPLTTDVELLGWGVRDELHVLVLPVSPAPRPSTALVLTVPAINPYLRALRSEQIEYPDECGTLLHHDDGRPHTLHLLGQAWAVLALLERCPAVAFSASLNALETRREATAAADALEAHHVH